MNKKPINGTEQMSQFSDAFFVRVAKVKYPGYDHYVLLRSGKPAIDSVEGNRHSVGLISGFEIVETALIDELWEAYQDPAFDKQGVRELKLHGDKPGRPDLENLLNDVVIPLVKKYGAQGAQLILHFERQIKTVSHELTIEEAREGLCTAIFHMEQFYRKGE